MTRFETTIFIESRTKEIWKRRVQRNQERNTTIARQDLFYTNIREEFDEKRKGTSSSGTRLPSTESKQRYQRKNSIQRETNKRMVIKRRFSESNSINGKYYDYMCNRCSGEKRCYGRETYQMCLSKPK